MGNFTFFTGPWSPYRDVAEAAEHMVYSDPNASMTKMRAFGEMMAAELWTRHKFPPVEQITQYDRIRELEGNDMIDRQVAFYFHELRVKGNKAAHNAMYGTPDEAIALLSVAYQLSIWFMRIELDQPTFHAPPFKKPLEQTKRPETPVVTPKPAPQRRAMNTGPALVPKKQPAREVKKEPTPQQTPPQTTRIVRKPKPKAEPATPTIQKELKLMPAKWLAVIMFVTGGITAAAIGTDHAENDRIGQQKEVAQPAPEKKKPITLITPEAMFGKDALRLLRGDAESTKKLYTYSDATMKEKAGKLLTSDSYAVYSVDGNAYQLYNGQYVSKADVAATSMEDVPVYQATANAETAYGTITVTLTEPLNVRSGPSTADEVVGVTYEGMTYSVYGQSGSWYRIDEGVWISANPQYVTFEKAQGSGT